MDRNKTIVVGVNESPSSRAALRYAVQLAGSEGARLMVAHVVPQAARTGGLYAVVPEYFEETSRHLLSETARLAEQGLGAGRVSTELLHGSVVSSLVRAAARGDAMVLGTDERSSMERLASGSTLIAVSTHCTVPVFIVPPSWTEPAEHPIITVGVRDIGSCEGLIATAFEMAEQRQGQVRAVHASGLPPAEGEATSPDSDLPAARLRDLLEQTTTAVRTKHPQIASEVRFIHGRPSEVLSEESATSDLLLLERRPHVFHAAHLGRTARALIRTSQCPIVVVPPLGAVVADRAGSTGGARV
jgi:nucleotide-binding universal stress UspA family protein